MPKQDYGEEIVTSIRVDRRLWQKVKIHAIEKGVKLQELIESLLKKELGEKK